MNLPPYRPCYRVMRQSENTATVACRHRWERRAWWCAKWKVRKEKEGVHYEVFPAVTS
ncbi:MAG TPA: hypothetical protein VE198_18560 [Actinoallomurus sp.]|nr:hypothetical protein [Actinoallomurus sp.]